MFLIVLFFLVFLFVYKCVQGTIHYILGMIHIMIRLQYPDDDLDRAAEVYQLYFSVVIIVP